MCREKLWWNQWQALASHMNHVVSEPDDREFVLSMGARGIKCMSFSQD
jgi:hypothetical protein